MRKILFTISFLVFVFALHAQNAYISTNGEVILYSGSIEKYNRPDIYVDAQYHTLLSTWTATISLTAPSAGAGNFIKIYQIEFSNTTVNSYTASGSTQTDKTQNVVMQAVAAYLLALNGGVTFTLN